MAAGDFSTVPQQHATPEDSALAFKDTVDRVIASGVPWMGVMFSVPEPGKLVMHRTTSNFPTESFVKAISELARNLEPEMQAPKTEPRPLPMAQRFMRQPSKEDGMPSDEDRGAG